MWYSKSRFSRVLWIAIQVCRLAPCKYFCTLKFTKILYYTTLPWSIQFCANTTRYSDIHFSRALCRPAIWGWHLTNTSAPEIPWSAAPRFTVYIVVLNSVYWNFIHCQTSKTTRQIIKSFYEKQTNTSNKHTPQKYLFRISTDWKIQKIIRNKHAEGT